MTVRASAPTSAAGGPGPVAMVVLVGMLCLIWGSTWLVIREGLETLPPFTSAAARFSLAAAVMIPVSLALSRREGGSRPPLWLVIATGTLQFALSYGIVYWVEQFLPSSLTSVLWAVYPLLMAVASHLGIPGERLCGRQAIGFILGFAGVCVLFATEIPRVGDRGLLAAVVLLVSPIAVAVSTVFLKRAGTGVSSLALNRDSMLLGAAQLVVVAFVVEDPTDVAWTRAAMLSVVYLALVGTVLAFSVYLWLLRYAPANKLAVIPYISPAVAIVLGVAVAGEEVTWIVPTGLMLILSGVVLVTRARPRRATS